MFLSESAPKYFQLTYVNLQGETVKTETLAEKKAEQRENMLELIGCRVKLWEQVDRPAKI